MSTSYDILKHASGKPESAGKQQVKVFVTGSAAWQQAWMNSAYEGDVT